MRPKSVPAALILSLCFVASGFPQSSVPADLDEWVAHTMQTCEVPGLSLAAEARTDSASTTRTWRFAP